MGTEIAKLQTHIRDFIEKEKIDKNNDGKINKENGELAELLSKTGAKDIEELMDEVIDIPWTTFVMGNTAVGAGFAAIANRLARVSKRMAAVNATSALCCMGITILSVLYGKFTKQNKTFELSNSPREEGKVTQEQKENKTELQSSYEKAFANLGTNNTTLNEYIPQKGEYWTSILKAKYNVDDQTAQKMANKIKEMIYGDPRAAKQTPVMYLPQTLVFEVKTYNYNANAITDKTTDYSNDIKPEQGNITNS